MLGHSLSIPIALGSLTPIIVVILVFTIGACRTTDSTIHTVDAIVYGTVTAASNTPVDDAVVTLTHHPGGCDTPDEGLGRDFTDSTGHFRTGLPVFGPPYETDCFLASVELPESSGLEAPEPKPFDADFRSTPPYDSVHIDAVLPPSEK